SPSRRAPDPPLPSPPTRRPSDLPHCDTESHSAQQVDQLFIPDQPGVTEKSPRSPDPVRHQPRCITKQHFACPALVPHHRFHQPRSEEHTSELQSRENLVCRLLLE